MVYYFTVHSHSYDIIYIDIYIEFVIKPLKIKKKSFLPLPEWEYNGNPDLVGYRIQYSKAGSKGGVLSHVILDRLEREFTIEDLEEWTEYEVRVQAINGIGSGPWSQAVHGRTRESGEEDDMLPH